MDRELILEEILDEISEGVHVVDEQGNSIFYNRKMAEIEAMKKEDVINKNILDVFQFPSEQDSTLLQALRKGLSVKNVRQTYLNAKGKEITTINHTFPIMREGKIYGAIEIANDVTKVERMIRENLFDKGTIKYTFDSIIGKSPAIQEVIQNAKRAARTSSSVLIVGETGTGKELFAQSIHYASIRSASPFLSQNCAALPDTLIEGLLFGTMKGAFTGAIERPGLFEQAESGTLFLDEMNSLSLPLQAKLLHALQEKVIRRIGDTRDRKIDVRILAAVNEDPIEAISNQRMRKDLFYRLGVVTLFIPPLRDRREDIFLLVDHFIEKYNRLFQLEVQGISREVYQFFMEHDWPGNVRELQHMIEGAMNLIGESTHIEYEHLPIHHLRRKAKSIEPVAAALSWEPTSYQRDLRSQVEEFEKFYIQKVLQECGGNISKAAIQLGMSRQSLQYRLRKFKA
ncbi:sigma-54-dependent Fis family transcriptional regulator [Ammoniphilus sp. YIM 78166]|uniref:sigma-54 interaction domain-containing protein n=1 Tax=Ammoniphilus sp. YIM 78166 TaxID=1644106 RepID=UPI00107064FD|nr:sigma 54-interacting transcriptional regulator [Ammoniphilus sp. YIM 78166]